MRHEKDGIKQMRASLFIILEVQKTVPMEEVLVRQWQRVKELQMN